MFEEDDKIILSIPDYTFEIKPGLESRNAYITDREISTNDSIYSRAQLLMINKMLTSERERLAAEYKVKLDAEKRTAWQNGNQAGITQTTNIMLSQVTPVIEKLETLILNITDRWFAFVEHQEEEVLELIIRMARKVIDTEIMIKPDIILNNLRRSLELLTEKEEIKILINPDDLNIVTENISKLKLSITLPQNLEIIPNESILPGGCKIDFKAGSIDADIDTQFNEIKRQIMKNA